MTESMLTTVDNPFDPFESFDEWYHYDCMLARQQNRPTCCSYLARVMLVADDVSDAEYNQVQNDMIDEICQLNLTGTYRKVSRSVPN